MKHGKLKARHRLTKKIGDAKYLVIDKFNNKGLDLTFDVSFYTDRLDTNATDTKTVELIELAKLVR